MILKGTFMLESPYFLLFRQFPLFRQLDHSTVVPQKLDISVGLNTMMLELIAISLLELSILRVIPQRQVIMLLTENVPLELLR